MKKKRIHYKGLEVQVHVVFRLPWSVNFLYEIEISIDQWSCHNYHLELNDIYEDLCPSGYV